MDWLGRSQPSVWFYVVVGLLAVPLVLIVTAMFGGEKNVDSGTGSSGSSSGSSSGLREVKPEDYRKFDGSSSGDISGDSGVSGSSGSSGSSGAGGLSHENTSNAPSVSPSGVTKTVAENLCVSRMGRDYELDSVLGATLAGDTWEVELSGIHEDVPYSSVISVECHVTGSAGSPYVSYYNEDVYEDYYINDDGFYEECWYGYDLETGECR